MSTNPALATHDTDEDAAHHPSDLDYIKIGIILGVLTAVEVLTYFVDFEDAAIPVLLSLMAGKFALVILYFMHLKFDNNVLLRLFVTGLALAIGVYIVVLFAFRYF